MLLGLGGPGHYDAQANAQLLSPLPHSSYVLTFVKREKQKKTYLYLQSNTFRKIYYVVVS